MSEKALECWVIYDHPIDYPNHWVMRKQWIEGGKIFCDRHCYVVPSLEDARAMVPFGAVCLPRSEEDPPHLYETWM